MADSNTGLWTTIAAAIPGFGALGWAIMRERNDSRQERALLVKQGSEDDASDAARANLDDATREIIDELRKDKATARAERDEARALAVLWERRARRVDSLAHVLRHRLQSALAALALARPGLPEQTVDPIPYLEDPLT